MAKKKESETLRQRRVAQQEFLRLKKMQSGEMDAGPKPSEIYEAPKTLGEKLKNIWYHDKLAIAIVGVIIALIAFLCVQCATKTEYDISVVVFTHRITGEVNCDKMGEYLKPYCKDINNDGEININVYNCTIEESQGNTDHSFTTRYNLNTVIFDDANALLFITDDSSYKDLNSITKDYPFLEGEPVEFQDDFYDFCKEADNLFTTPEGLQISCRTIDERAIIAGDENIDLYYEHAQSILKGLKDKYSE